MHVYVLSSLHLAHVQHTRIYRTASTCNRKIATEHSFNRRQTRLIDAR